jgi:hypothetical protein
MHRKSNKTKQDRQCQNNLIPVICYQYRTTVQRVKTNHGSQRVKNGPGKNTTHGSLGSEIDRVKTNRGSNRTGKNMHRKLNKIKQDRQFQNTVIPLTCQTHRDLTVLKTC